MTATTDLRLLRYPLAASLEDYGHAAHELESRLLELPGLVALYGTGAVSAPGISDVDRIAVVDGHRPVPSVWERLSGRTRYLAMHSPFLVDTATFRRHRWFAHLEPLELLHGTEVGLEAPPDPGYARRLAGAESLVIMALRLVKQIWTAQVKVRPLLCELHNLRHDLTLGGLGRDRAPDAWAVGTRLERCVTRGSAIRSAALDATHRGSGPPEPPGGNRSARCARGVPAARSRRHGARVAAATTMEQRDPAPGAAHRHPAEQGSASRSPRGRAPAPRRRVVVAQPASDARTAGIRSGAAGG